MYIHTYIRTIQDLLVLDASIISTDPTGLNLAPLFFISLPSSFKLFVDRLNDDEALLEGVETWVFRPLFHIRMVLSNPCRKLLETPRLISFVLYSSAMEYSPVQYWFKSIPLRNCSYFIPNLLAFRIAFANNLCAFCVSPIMYR